MNIQGFLSSILNGLAHAMGWRLANMLPPKVLYVAGGIAVVYMIAKSL